MKPNYQILTQRTADLYGVTVAELLGPSKDRRLSWPRFAVWAALCQMRGEGTEGLAYSTTMIARVFDRDHTTIIHGIRRAKELGLKLPARPVPPAPHIAGATAAFVVGA